jgi:peptidyl-tRNA hydrolase, PTH1 family
MAAKYLIVGLGNPGAKYEKTRHNVGWWVIDELVRRYNLGGGRDDKRAITWDGIINGKKVKLAKPLTYMNLSGESVRPLMDYYDIPLENLIVIHDDLDTPFGVLKLRKTGGHGGQNGIRNIIQHLGTKDFTRARFGIGRPPGKMRPVDFVLQAFQGDDEILAHEVTGKAVKAIETWLTDGVDDAMTQHNGDINGKNEPKVKPKEQLKIYQRAHDLAPSDPKPLSKLISIQKKLGKLDDAVANHLKLANMYDEIGKPHLARSEKEKAVTIHPDLVDIQRDIAEWYVEKNNPKKAVSRYLILTDYFIQQNDIENAVQTAEIALEINPQHPKTIEIYKSLMEGTTQD